MSKIIKMKRSDRQRRALQRLEARWEGRTKPWQVEHELEALKKAVRQ